MSETSHRPVRSFVLRQGRMSNAQGHAHETLMPRF
jgi:tRNA (guanine-N7-)-methyltransferase